MEIDLQCKNKFCIVLYLKLTRFHDDQWTITQIAGGGKSRWIITRALPRGSARATRDIVHRSPHRVALCTPPAWWQRTRTGQLHPNWDALTPLASPHSCPIPWSMVCRTPCLSPQSPKLTNPKLDSLVLSLNPASASGTLPWRSQGSSTTSGPVSGWAASTGRHFGACCQVEDVCSPGKCPGFIFASWGSTAGWRTAGGLGPKRARCSALRGKCPTARQPAALPGECSYQGCSWAWRSQCFPPNRWRDA